MKSFVALTLLLCAIRSATAGELFARDRDHDYDAPAPGSYNLGTTFYMLNINDGALLDSNAKSLSLRELIRGRVTVVSFIYTRCAAPNACPYATGVLSQLHRASLDDETLARSLRLVSLSFDPEYDTPERLADYAEVMRDEKSGCEWRFATAKSQADLESVLNAYGQAVDKRQNPADPQGPLYHILRVFLIDREGRIRNIYSSGTLDPRLVLADVRTLLLEESKLSKQ